MHRSTRRTKRMSLASLGDISDDMRCICSRDTSSAKCEDNVRPCACRTIFYGETLGQPIRGNEDRGLRVR
jgi:hypothetical protein